MANARMYWLHCLSPTHVGTGRGIGYIDLPIHRDKVTNWPMVPGSAFKGVWADHYQATDANRRANPELKAAFGIASDEGPNASNAGALVPTDARIVCLPVRSFQGTFAWCTSPLALAMLKRDLELAGAKQGLPGPVGTSSDTVLHGENSALLEEGRIYLEDLDFNAEQTAEADRWAGWIARQVFPDDLAWHAEFHKRFAILPDVVFDFLTETGTEVTARVRIDDETKTVARGQLWNEESLPAETILAGLIFCDRVYEKETSGLAPATLLAKYTSHPLALQIGGKATVGRGRVRCVFADVSGGGE